jgi:hypothetical protein
MKEFMYEVVEYTKVNEYNEPIDSKVLKVIDVYGWSDEQIISKFFNNERNVTLKYLHPLCCEVYVENNLKYGIFGFEPTE